MKRLLETDANAKEQCKAASESLLQLSRQWALTIETKSFTEEQV
jgi:hypothetical protein